MEPGWRRDEEAKRSKNKLPALTALLELVAMGRPQTPCSHLYTGKRPRGRASSLIFSENPGRHR